MAEPISLVRDQTTENEEWLPDSKIQEYLDFYGEDQWLLAAAYCLEYMAREDIYEQYARGDVRITKPLLRERARELRHRATYDDGGYTITQSTLTRADREEDTDVEYSRQHPPYVYGAGLVRTIKDRSNGA